MERFRRIESIALPIPRSNIDTDQILPARFLQKPRSGGFGQFLFHDVDFLKDPRYGDAKVVVAGENFGCGSSRENAVWALYDHGFRVAIAPSFGDIFRSNCLKNGLLPVVLDTAAMLAAAPQTLAVDLESQTVTLPDGTKLDFDVDPFAKHLLLNGVDELDYTLSRMREIEEFEQQRP